MVMKMYSNSVINWYHVQKVFHILYSYAVVFDDNIGLKLVAVNRSKAPQVLPLAKTCCHARV